MNGELRFVTSYENSTQAKSKVLSFDVWEKKLSAWKDWAGEKKIPTKFGPFDMQINRYVVINQIWLSNTSEYTFPNHFIKTIAKQKKTIRDEKIRFLYLI